MRELPILFSTAMVQAIQRGEKTQTRRVLKHQPDVPDYKIGGTFILSPDAKGRQYVRFHAPNAQFTIGPGSDVKLPYAVGDRLWVRETWRKLFCDQEEPCLDCQECRQAVAYKADCLFPGNYSTEAGYRRDELWRPSIFLPKELARIWLEVTGVRVERLQDISEADAIAEGFKDRAEFLTFWDVLNAKRGFSAASNCWVGVNKFKRTEEPPA